MALEPLGDGETTGWYTDLRIVNFSNAVLRGLSLHPRAVQRSDGIELPINEDSWHEVCKREFPNKKPGKHSWTQPLAMYVSYYNGGTHGLGFDKSGRFDFGKGDRDTRDNKGKCGSRAAGTTRLIVGTKSLLKPDDIIALAKRTWENFDRPPVSAADTTNAARALDAESFFSRVVDEDKRIMRPILIRRGQPQFRQALLRAYESRCAISNCDAEPALEAAHLVPFSEVQQYLVSGGLLLRADLHTLFDLHLFGIQPSTRRIALARALKRTEYRKFENTEVREPDGVEHQLDQELLKRQWSVFTNNADRD